MITGLMFLDALRDACTRLQFHKDALNEMNVFPVPDGDTGTNMLRTLSAVTALDSIPDEPLSQTADRIASAMLRQARGNSGIMLSLLFRGMAQSFTAPVAHGRMLADGLKTAFEYTWGAVPQPREGTVLTVARAAAVSAQKHRNGTVQEVISEACAGALQGLQATRDLLPALKKAQVVDAGGYGYWIVLCAMAEHFGGSFTAQTFSSAPQTTFSCPEYKYCTEMWIRRFPVSGKPVDFQKLLSDCGNCGTAVPQQDRIKIHVHTDTPWLVLQKALEIGTVYDIKIDNMTVQVGQRG